VVQYLAPVQPKYPLHGRVDCRDGGSWKEGRITRLLINASEGWISAVEIDKERWDISASHTFMLAQSSPSLARFRTHTVEKFDREELMCRMLFPSSGRVGFDRLKVHPDTHPQLFQLWTKLAIKYAEEHTKQKFEEQSDEKKEKFIVKGSDMSEDEKEEIRKTFLMAIVKREASLRLTSYAQQEMDRYRHSEAQVTVVTEGLQLRAVHEFGFLGKAQEQMGLSLLQSASNMYPDHPQIQDTYYVKFNRCESGNLIAGQECPDVPLYTPQGGRTTLMTHYRQIAQSQCGYEEKSDQPAPLLVIVAGSST